MGSWRGWRALGIPAVLVAGVVAVVLAARVHPSEPYVRYSEAELATVTNIHDHKGKPVCQACHPERAGKLAEDPVALCQRCHETHGGNHPLGVPVPEPSLKALPLPGGRLVCHTCHEPHSVMSPVKGVRIPSAALCVQCHRGHF